VPVVIWPWGRSLSSAAQQEAATLLGVGLVADLEKPAILNIAGG